MKKFLSQMRMFDPSHIADLSSYFAILKELSIGMKVGGCLVAFILLMGLLITFGNRGLIDNYMMTEKLAALKKSNQDILLENRDLKRSIALLSSDLIYIEVVARNELGMVRKGDLVYRYAQ
jgi:cell division protein FtsB